MDILVSNMHKVIKKHGVMIIIETLSGNIISETPEVSERVQKLYMHLENNLKFNRMEIRTDYKFDSVEQAFEALSFWSWLDKESLKKKISGYPDSIIPECTGIWYLKNE